jgi:hypothetical protein
MPGPSWVVYKSDGLNDYSSGYGRTNGLTADELFFCENRERATTIAESTDPHASYDYDDYALAELDGLYYVFNTSGCSCPSPEETWGLVFKGTRDELLAFLDSGGASEAWREFLRQVERGGITLLSPAPAPSERRYDW